MESFSTIVDCNESLDSGNIIGGYGELNWMILKIVEIPHALNSTHIGYNAQLSFINGVETIQEIPKLKWWITLYMVNV